MFFLKPLIPQFSQKGSNPEAGLNNPFPNNGPPGGSLVGDLRLSKVGILFKRYFIRLVFIVSFHKFVAKLDLPRMEFYLRRAILFGVQAQISSQSQMWYSLP